MQCIPALFCLHRYKAIGAQIDIKIKLSLFIFTCHLSVAQQLDGFGQGLCSIPARHMKDPCTTVTAVCSQVTPHSCVVIWVALGTIITNAIFLHRHIQHINTVEHLSKTIVLCMATCQNFAVYGHIQTLSCCLMLMWLYACMTTQQEGYLLHLEQTHAPWLPHG